MSIRKGTDCWVVNLVVLWMCAGCEKELTSTLYLGKRAAIKTTIHCLKRCVKHVRLLLLLVVPSALQVASTSGLVPSSGLLMSTAALQQYLPRMENLVQTNTWMAAAAILTSAWECKAVSVVAAAAAAAATAAAATAAAAAAAVC